MQAGRLVLDLADMHQRTTQSYVRRPYGVGMLVAAHDQTGPHLFQTCPSGNYFEYVAMAIGARSQSAKTYLEKHFEEFEVRRKGFSFVRARSLRSYIRQTEQVPCKVFFNCAFALRRKFGRTSQEGLCFVGERERLRESAVDETR